MPENRTRTCLLLLASWLLPMLLYSLVLELPFMCDTHFGLAGAAGETYTVTGEHRVDNPIDPEVFQAFPQTVPWWTSPDARLLFLRPLVNLSARIDYLIWGKSTFGFHLTNLLFHGLACLFLFLVGRRLLKSDWAAFLAVMIFSSHPYNILVVGWVAERASVLTMTFGLAGLAAHIRYRRGGNRAWVWELGAWVLFVLAFLARESGCVALVSYFLYDVIVWYPERAEPRPPFFGWALRLVGTYALLCIPLGLFIVYYKVAGYGVVGHYSILDEGVSTGSIFTYILKNAVLYLLSMIFFVPISNQMNLELFSRPIFLVPFLVLLCLLGLLLVLGARARLHRDRRVLFLAAWLLMSLLPILQLLTQNRYVYPAMAPFGLLASTYLFTVLDTRALGRFTRVFFGALVFFLTVFPMAGVWIKNDAFRRHHGFQYRLVGETLERLGSVTAEQPVNVIFLNMPNAILTFALQYAYDYQSEKGAVRAFPLIMTPTPPRVEVLGDSSLRITSRSNPLLQSEGERLFISGDLDREGMTRENLFFRSTIEEVDETGVRSVRFDFTGPLAAEDNRFFFMDRRDIFPVNIPRGFRGELPLDVPREGKDAAKTEK